MRENFKYSNVGGRLFVLWLYDSASGPRSNNAVIDSSAVHRKVRPGDYAAAASQCV